jgi:hypothetical protein
MSGAHMMRGGWSVYMANRFIPSGQVQRWKIKGLTLSLGSPVGMPSLLEQSAATRISRSYQWLVEA